MREHRIPLCPAHRFGRRRSRRVRARLDAVDADDRRRRRLCRFAAGVLSAFDAAGVTGCSGAPKTCTPLWTAEPVEGGVSAGHRFVVDGVLYVISGRVLAAYDASGTTGCSGTPKTCEPLWTAEVGGSSTPAVVDGVLYTGADRRCSRFTRSEGPLGWVSPPPLDLRKAAPEQNRWHPCRYRCRTPRPNAPQEAMTKLRGVREPFRPGGPRVERPQRSRVRSWIQTSKSSRTSC